MNQSQQKNITIKCLPYGQILDQSCKQETKFIRSSNLELKSTTTTGASAAYWLNSIE